MKKYILAIILLTSLNGLAQTKPKVYNSTVDSRCNFKEIGDIKTNKTYTDSKGKISTVYSTKTGKLFIENGISEKTGKMKRKYLTIKP